MTSVFSACRSCGYDLAGLEAPGVCPECGHAFTERAGDDEITLAWPCLNCAYSLAGLRRNQKCSECGMPVAVSVDPALFRFQPEPYRRAVKRGALLVGLGVLTTAFLPIVIGAIAAFNASATAAIIASGFAGLLGLAIFAIGWFTILAPAPASLALSEKQQRVRIFARRALVVYLAVALVSFAIHAAVVAPSANAPLTGQALRLVGVLALGVFVVAALLALRPLFARARSAKKRSGAIAIFTLWTSAIAVGLYGAAAVGGLFVLSRRGGSPLGTVSGIVVVVMAVVAGVCAIIAFFSLLGTTEGLRMALRRVEREIAFAHRGARRPVTTSETPGAERPNTIEP